MTACDPRQTSPNLILNMTNTNDIQWKRTAAEGVAIVVSILLAFWIDTWWEDRKEARLEVVYLLELQEDFEQNKSRLEKEVADIEKTARSMFVLQEQSALDSPSMSVSELNENFSQIINMTSFYPINRAYTNMTGSGDLKLIRSRPIKNALAEYYAAAQITVLVQNTHEMELVQIYEPYIIENLVRNILIQKSVITTDLIDQFRQMLERTNNILKLLKSANREITLGET